jgi:pterin-4a-carbinolamine dehydratase
MVASLEGHARRFIPAGFEGWKGNAVRNAAALEFRYADFNQAFAFVTEIALKTEQMTHYNRVSVLCSTQARMSNPGVRFVDPLAT